MDRVATTIWFLPGIESCPQFIAQIHKAQPLLCGEFPDCDASCLQFPGHLCPQRKVHNQGNRSSPPHFPYQLPQIVQ
jgi:hypothetical protein